MPGVLEDDMHEIASDPVISWSEMKNWRILVTGATGTIGSALVRGLHAASEKHGLGIEILALGRDESKAEPLIKKYGAVFIRNDIREPLSLKGKADCVFHCAALAKSPDMASNPVGVIETSLKGTMNVLEFAREKRVKSMVFLSSMEVYGITDPALPFVSESMLGEIDLNSSRSCYPESKRMCENMCFCYFAQHKVPVKMARLAQTFGAGSSKHDTLVAAQFAKSAVSGKDIILHTEGASRGNYCYISDAVRALILICAKGENGQAYNVSNPDASMTIREMADLVAGISKNGVSVVMEKPADFEKRGYAPNVTRRLSSEKMEGLGWQPKYGLSQMYLRMMSDWLESGTAVESECASAI
ncbi:MAG: NAD(P)-dependent oxidoreductase [Clostridiales bacterium]|jgi:nucleoside-diphosphate-sugar epimerase|nr:NAD(P)-dependent oxidoreductase [Clostridiales bacterium]